ncbi:MAG: type II toxin-antitoxin system MqsR family toxin [Pseudomonadota bacterium]
MEKNTPHCKLLRIKALVGAGKFRATRSALLGAANLGMDLDDIVDVILNLSWFDFYKSMTSLGDHRVWQDVYRPLVGLKRIYLKLTVVDDVLIVSFKEL